MKKQHPRRKRLAVNLTLSEEAKEEGTELAEFRGIRLSQLVEQLLRAELIKEGRIPPSPPRPEEKQES